MKVALVTGANKGLGFEWCKQLGKLGYEVILAARDIDAASDASQSLKDLGLSVTPAVLDVTNELEIRELARWVEDKYGKLDLLVNNAGVNSKTRAKGDKALMQKNLTLEALDSAEVLAMIQINAIAPIFIARAFQSLLSKSENPIIIQIGSWLGSLTVKNTGGNYGYAVSKSSLNMMNRALAFDLLDDRIICVVVNPGWVQTEMGGEHAQFTTQHSVSNMIHNVVNQIKLADTGKFFNYDGEEHPW